MSDILDVDAPEMPEELGPSADQPHAAAPDGGELSAASSLGL